MKNIHREVYKIKFNETDYSTKIKMHSLINYMQETSSIHAELLGVGYEDLKKHNLFWVVSRLKINMNKYVNWNDEIIVETWPSGVDKMFFTRSFRIYDKEENHIGDINAAYLLVAEDSMFPQRISKLPIDIPSIENRFEPYERLEKIKFPKCDKVLVAKKKVRYNDIDLNLHVNNAKYIEWVEDCFPLEIYKDMRIETLQLNFIKEAKCGEKIFFYKYNDLEDENTCYIEGVEKQSESQIFQCKLTFNKL
jgi:acyl-ACP thioesterase